MHASAAKETEFLPRTRQTAPDLEPQKRSKILSTFERLETTKH
jgi:hypothetical protein